MEGKRIREILHHFVKSDYKVLTIFQSNCKKESQRIIIFSNYTTPRPGITDYTIKGKDITDLIEDLKVHSFEIPGQLDLGLSIQIESIPEYTYVFSQDYSIELIRQ